MNSRNRRRNPDVSHRRKRWNFFWKLCLCMVFLFFTAIGGYRFVKGFQYWQRNREIRNSYAEEVNRLIIERQRLQEEIYKLKHKDLAQERLAREMGYIKPGETVYRFVSK